MYLAYLALCLFVFSCQYFVISSCVCRWYFLRRPGDQLTTPDASNSIFVSYWLLIRYHLGSLVVASFILSHHSKSIECVYRCTSRASERLVSSSSSCSSSPNQVSRGLAAVLATISTFLGKLLLYSNIDTYNEIALTGRSFFQCAERSLARLKQDDHSSRLVQVNLLCHFLMGTCKLLIVMITLWLRGKLIKVEQLESPSSQLAYSWSPVLIAAFTAYLVAQCFLSLYEACMNSLLLSFTEEKISLQQLSLLQSPHLWDEILMHQLHSDGDSN